MAYPWAQRAAPASGRFRVGEANGLLWAVETDFGTGPCRTFTSADGISWTQMGDLPGTNGRWAPPAYSTVYGRYVAVTTQGASGIAWSDSGGSMWFQAQANSSFGWNSVTYSPARDLFVAAGTEPFGSTTTVFRSSPDGVSWTNRAVANGTWIKALWCSGFNAGAGRFIGIGEGPANYSNDGITWTAATGYSATGRDVCYSSSLNRAVAANTNGIKTTTDGATWAAATLPAHPEAGSGFSWSPTCCAWDATSGKFIVGMSGSSSGAWVLVSSNGTTWTPEAIPAAVEAQSMAVLGGVPIVFYSGVNSLFLSGAPTPTDYVDADSTVLTMTPGEPRTEFTADAEGTALAFADTDGQAVAIKQALAIGTGRRVNAGGTKLFAIGVPKVGP